jgi:hypothetical protein
LHIEEGAGNEVWQEFSEGGREAALGVLADILAKKATGTLLVRASAISQFLDWAKGAGVAPFPMCERIAYRYVVYLNSIRAPATRASSFRGAVAFMLHVLGVDSCKQVVGSSRIGGAAFRALQRKRETVQATPLTVAQLMVFQNAVQDTKISSKDRVLAGFVCFCVEGRLRCSDAQRLMSEPRLDVAADGAGYIEATAGLLKSSKAKQRRGRALQVAGHALDLLGRGWAKTWLDLRFEVGLD